MIKQIQHAVNPHVSCAVRKETRQRTLRHSPPCSPYANQPNTSDADSRPVWTRGRAKQFASTRADLEPAELFVETSSQHRHGHHITRNAQSAAAVLVPSELLHPIAQDTRAQSTQSAVASESNAPNVGEETTCRRSNVFPNDVGRASPPRHALWRTTSHRH